MIDVNKIEGALYNYAFLYLGRLLKDDIYMYVLNDGNQDWGYKVFDKLLNKTGYKFIDRVNNADDLEHNYMRRLWMLALHEDAIKRCERWQSYYSQYDSKEVELYMENYDIYIDPDQADILNLIKTGKDKTMVNYYIKHLVEKMKRVG